MIDNYVQDGLDCLDKSEEGYFLIIPFGKRTIYHWNLCEEQKKQIIKALEDGWLTDNIINLLKQSLE